MTTPRLKVPGEPEDGDGDDGERRSHFIKGAVVSGFAVVPLKGVTLFLSNLNTHPFSPDSNWSFLRCTNMHDILFSRS